MKTMLVLTLNGALLLLASGCAANSPSHSARIPGAADLSEATFVQKELGARLSEATALTARIKAAPGSSYTHVEIYNLNRGAARSRAVSEIAAFKQDHPGLKPLEVIFWDPRAEPVVAVTKASPQAGGF